MLSRAWTWSVPAAAAIGFGMVMVAVVTTLVVAATSQHNYRRTRLAALGAGGLIVLDTAMLAAVVLAAPTLVWPMALAVSASLVGIGLTFRAVLVMLAR